jgi:hypothetical protein
MKQFLQFFRTDNLPAAAVPSGKAFFELATQLIRDLPANPESTVAMRKLMEARDCAVRSVLFKSES